MSHNISHKTLS